MNKYTHLTTYRVRSPCSDVAKVTRFMNKTPTQSARNKIVHRFNMYRPIFESINKSKLRPRVAGHCPRNFVPFTKNVAFVIRRLNK